MFCLPNNDPAGYNRIYAGTQSDSYRSDHGLFMADCANGHTGGIYSRTQAIPFEGPLVLGFRTHPAGGVGTWDSVWLLFSFGQQSACVFHSFVEPADHERPTCTLVKRQACRHIQQINVNSSGLAETWHAVALYYFMYYNFCRVHSTLRVTSAMEAVLADHVWDIEELIALPTEPAPKKRGPYKKRLA